MRAPLYSKDPSEILSRSAIEDPHPLFARLRSEAPLSRIGETGVHLVASWALIEEALARDFDFSANLTGVLVRAEDGLPACFEMPETGMTDVIATADDPRHAAHREISQPRLASGQILHLEERLRGWTRAALAPFIAAGGGDFAPISEAIPALVVAHVLGLPERDVERFRVWSMIGGDMLAGDASIEVLIKLATETGQMVEYLGEHFDRALENPEPGPDAPLLHALARGVQSGSIGREEALGISIVMFGAGGESTAALIGSAINALGEHPEIEQALRKDPGLIPRFVEEVVRLEPPFKFHYRSVRTHCQLGGFDLEPGDRLMLLWASANRDASIFEDPEACRLDRRYSKRHMSFGRGGHFCIGAPLARLEAAVVVGELLERTRKIEVLPDAASGYANSIFTRRFERLAVQVEAKQT